MKSVVVSFILEFSLMLLAGCHSFSFSERLEYALLMSGSNRLELEKVLDHYSKCEKDSLSLRAALFLIENMPGHYTVNNGYLKSHRKMIDSLYSLLPTMLQSVEYSVSMYKCNVCADSCSKIEDVEIITSDFLISHIDNRIRMWKECDWLSDVSFDDFCDYLLPYRISNEPIWAIDSTVYRWNFVLDAMNYYEYTPYFMEDVRRFYETVIRNSDKSTQYRIASIDGFDCVDVSHYDALSARNLGIPATVDKVIDWATRNGRHSWYRDIDSKRLGYTFDGGIIPRTGKIYRRTYSHNSIPKQFSDELVPAFFHDPFYKDVTREYIKTGDVNIPTYKYDLDDVNNIYLSVFNEMHWKPTAWTQNIKGMASFNSMGCDIIYLPTYYRHDTVNYFSNPFYVNTDGMSHYFCPDTLNTISMNLRRKYPLTIEKIKWGLELSGCCLEASNDVDFKESDTLDIILKTGGSLNWISLDINTDKLYRYWRLSKNNTVFSLSEIEFYDGGGNELKGDFYNQNGIGIGKICDKNKLSFDYIFNWIKIDFKKSIGVKTVYILPHTDDNSVNKGDTYQLFYCNQGKWISLGIRIAEEDELIFHNVPSNAVYLLRNLCSGREERIFTCQNNRIRFW